MLLIGPLCVGALAQPPLGAARPDQYTVAPSQTPPGAPMPIPQYYAPPATQPRTFGLSALSQPVGGYATPVAAVVPQSSRPAGSPPPVDRRSGAPDGGLRARFPKLLQNVRNATMTPGQKLARQAAGNSIPTTQPVGGVPPRLVRAQAPVALPQGPVVVYMPAGWQPPQDTTFAPRQMNPEVPADFWPESTRNPFGEISGNGGLLRWPKFSRPNSPDELPVEKPQRTRALLASSEAAPGDDSRTTATKRAWNALLGTTSGGEAARTAGGHQGGKALFSGLASSNPPRRPAAAPAMSTVSTDANRAQPATRPMVNRQVTRSPVSSVAPASSAQTTAAGPPSASRLKSKVLADFQPSATENTSGQLKWRAKGAPRVSPPAVDNSRNQMAAHAQPVAAQPTSSVQPAMTYPAVQQQPVPVTNQTSAPAPVVRQKALIPKSVLTGKPSTPSPTPAQPVPQPSPPAMTGGAVPQAAGQTVAPDPANTTAGSGKALFPNMFAKDSPMAVGLTTKPPAPSPVSMPQPAQPVYVVLAPQASAEMIESYYAPPREHQPEPPGRSSKRRPRPEIPADERPRAKTARSKSVDPQPEPSREELTRMAHEQAAAARSQPPPEYVSPLEKPLRAIAEMTKLPKFITGESQGRSARPRAFRERYRATVARRADSRGKPNRGIEAEQLEDDDLAELESEVAPDVSVDLPSERLENAGEKSRDEANPRQHSEYAAHPSKKPTAREELDRLYRSAVAGLEETGNETAAAADDEIDEPEESAAAEAPDEHAGRKANVPAVAIEESAAPPTSEPKATRIRKSDGSSVTVYHVGSAARAAQDAREPRDVAVGNAPQSKSRSSGRRQVVRESRSDVGTLRKNPLR